VHIKLQAKKIQKAPKNAGDALFFTVFFKGVHKSKCLHFCKICGILKATSFSEKRR
jgi:hypothetical protein